MLYSTQEQQVSLVSWKDWLYKCLLIRSDPSLALGLAELVCGGSTQRPQPGKHRAFYILSGEGAIEYGGMRHLFKTGTQFMEPLDVEYHFDCDYPTRLLVATYQLSLELAFAMEELKPTQLVSGQGQCQFVVSGRIKISIHDITQWLTAGTAFYVEPNTGYTLQNIGNTKALILIVSGKAEPVGHGQHQGCK